MFLFEVVDEGFAAAGGDAWRGQTPMATGAAYGARDAGRERYLHAQNALREHGLVEIKLENGALLFLRRPWRRGHRSFARVRLPDCRRSASSAWKSAVSSLEKKLYLKEVEGAVKCRG